MSRFAIILSVAIFIFLSYLFFQRNLDFTASRQIDAQNCYKAENRTVRGASMEPTLKDGEQVRVDTNYYKTRNLLRGDIIAFKFKTQEKPFVKRVIALEGDKLEFGEDGNIYLNGKKLEEPYLADKNYHFDPLKLKVLLIPLSQTNNTVPEGSVFVLGDNRRASFDSENYGFVPVEYILGKVVEH